MSELLPNEPASVEQLYELLDALNLLLPRTQQWQQTARTEFEAWTFQQQELGVLNMLGEVRELIDEQFKEAA